MAKAVNHTKTYIIIWALLAVLTALEIAAAQVIPHANSGRWIALVLLAVAKVAFVALWYMHLKMERSWLKFIAVVPAIAGVYAVVLMLEVVAR